MPSDIQYNSYNTASVPVLYTPDFSFLKYVLDKKNQNYEQGMSKSISAYSDVLNAPLTKDVNKTSRDAYIKSAQEQIQKIAGTDLSLQQNVNSAVNVFSPFWDDKDVVSDYNFTRQQTSQLQAQYAMQNSKDKEVQDQFSTVPIALMQNRIEKVKNAKKGDLSVYDQPVVRSTPFYNITKEAKEFIKENDYKVTSTVTRNGRVETYVNGAGTVMTFQELVQQLRGTKYQAQDQMMGDYHTMETIKDIQKDYEAKGIKMSEEEAKNHILEYHQGSKVASLEQYGVSIGERTTNLTKQLDDMWAKNDPSDIENIAKLQSDILQLQDYKKNNDTEIADWKNPNSDTYKEAQKSISHDPSRFFSDLYTQTQINNTARILAAEQSVKVEYDQGYWEGKKLEQNAILAHEKNQNDLIIKQMEIAVKGNSSDGSDGSSGGGGPFVDFNNNGINDLKEKESVNMNYNTPTVVDAKASILTSTDKVGTAKQYLFNEKNSAIVGQFELLQTEGDAIVGKYITSGEAGIMKTALATQNFKDPAYAPAFKSIVKKLKDAGKIKNELEISGPVGLMNFITSEIEKDMEEKLTRANANRTNPALRAEALKEAQVLRTVRVNRDKLNDMYAREKQLDKDINAEMSKPGFENIRVKNDDGTFGVISYREVMSKYNLPENIAKQYINGTLDVETENVYDTKPRTFRYGAYEDVNVPTLVGQRHGVKSADGKDWYDLTDLVNTYGTSKTLHTNLEAGMKKAGATLDNSFLTVFNTGNMGKAVTYGSDTKQEKQDMGDIVAADILGPGMKYELVNDSPILNFSDNDDAKEFATKLMARLSQSPGAGLTSVTLKTIGEYDPTKREVNLKYSLDDIQKLFTAAEIKKYATQFTEYANSGEGLVLQLRNNETVRGFPTANSMGYYDMLLSENKNYHIKNDNIEEQLGVKYDVYKDGTGKILYKAAVEIITPDPKAPGGYTSKMVDPTNPSVSEEYNTYKILPPGTDVEQFIKGLQEKSIAVFSNNSNIISNVTKPVTSLKELYPNLWKQYQKLQ
jgi:galactitol-specific phosphotransferase system IIB component